MHLPCTSQSQGTHSLQAFKRHASLGFLAASAFPLPKDYISGVTLPAGLSMDGEHCHIG